VLACQSCALSILVPTASFVRHARKSKASGKESGSFLKKRTKKLLQIQAEPPRKGRSQSSKSFLLLFFKRKAFLLLALPAPACLGSYLFSKKKTLP
jgi:hypothetical protein